jgi:hypothetical protein
MREELDLFRSGRSQGSWENFLYFAARDYYDALPDDARGATTEREVGITHLGSQTALAVAAQVIRLSDLDPARFDARLGEVDAPAGASDAVVINVDYPLGVAAYNILREICEDRDTLRGLYVWARRRRSTPTWATSCSPTSSSTSTRGRRTGWTTRSRSRTSPRSCASARAWTTSARSR